MLGKKTLFVVGLLVTAGVILRLVLWKGDEITVDDDKVPTVERTATVSGTHFQTPPDVIAPSQEKWPSELFAAAVKHAVDALKARKPKGDLSANVFRSDFVLQATKSIRVPAVQNEQYTVWRADGPSSEPELTGKEAIDAFVKSLVPFGNDAESKIRTAKIISSDLAADGGITRIRFESATQRDDKFVAQKISTWDCKWSWQVGQSAQLVRADPVSEETTSRNGTVTFVDKTNAVARANDSFQTQLSYGMQHWLARIETAHGMNYFSKYGLAIADANGDGLDDLYVCQPGGLPNRLFIQTPQGTVLDESKEFGLDLLDRTTSALFVDLDNDGDQDFAAATLIGLLIFENQANAKFQLKLTVPFEDIDLQGLSAVDFDQDGDLDLYQIVDYASAASRGRYGLPSFVYHNANDGGRNRLIRNDIDSLGRWRFSDVTDAVGLNQKNQRHSLAAAWEDYDNDGDPDLYVANDYGANCLYVNQNGRFEERANPSGVVDFGSGMSVSWGDYDRDGNMDLYVANMFSSAGNRLTTQDGFLPELPGEGKLLYRRFAKGNSLFRNQGDGQFEETGKLLNVEIARWAWGSKFVDVNNDGWEDLLVANGYITTDDTGDL